MSEINHANLLNDELVKKIKLIIENGIYVDKNLRVQSSYNGVNLFEIESEIFASISELLQNRDIPIYLAQQIAWYYLQNDYKLSFFEDFSEVKSVNEDESIKTFDRQKILRYLRNSIQNILSNWFSNHGTNVLIKERDFAFEYDHFGIKNKRRSMEDRYAIIDDINMIIKKSSFFNNPHSLFAIFDGHNGIEAPHYLSSHLPMSIIRHDLYESDIKKAIFDSFEKINKELSNKAVSEKFRSGSTACLVIIRNNKLHIAWSGDSQCCLIRQDKTFYMTEPHKPNNGKEKERIESLGGCVSYTSEDWRVNGVLSVSRSFGDIDYQPFITCRPDYIEIDLCSKDEYLIIGCDGLWEHSSINENLSETIEFINKIINDKARNNTVSENLVYKAQESGSLDNISAIFISLKKIKIS